MAFNSGGCSADTCAMDLVSSISALSTSYATAKLQMEVSAKLLKLANSQGQETAVRLLNAAMQSMEESIERMAGDAGSQIDTFA